MIIGSGINALVAAAELSREGRDVLVCERNSRAGGAIRTESDFPAPGYTTDVFSCWHPLFVGGPAHPGLRDELQRRGVVYRNTDLPAGVALADGTTAVLSTDTEATATGLDDLHPGDGDAWRGMLEQFGQRADLAFAALGTELWSVDGMKLGARAARRLGALGTLEFAQSALEPARAWLRRTFAGEGARALLSPWIGHNGLGPEDAGSALINKVIALALAQGGCPVPEGGGIRLVEALSGIVRDAGGEVRTGADVSRVLVEDGRARGVLLCDGERIGAREGVLASVTPQALYFDLLADEPTVPGSVRAAADRYRYGRGDMQVHLAMSEPPRWRHDHERLSRTAVVHATPGLDGVSAAVSEADRNLLPSSPTIVCGQPAALDPTRVPAGGGALWIQLQETPFRPTGDAAGDIDVGDGQWTPELADRYADRVLNRLSQHIDNLDSALVDRAVISPADLQRANCNLVNGDPYAGSCRLDQFLLWRPMARAPGHRTSVAGLWHIGASTHPGPGLAGASGHLVAQDIIGGTGVRSRLRRWLPG
ncbi:phytoene dehydrogenase-like protein [Halopolyspora algeriensis]|uniref:Pyridine nucleotide-disulfide oxidoreductase domain-containing protein 2 n=1 Tax=Halopolyspora algeriensis TaxID=1500506 RepID=A0A368VZ39_9ACTN|nr:phytoene dehydrogenase-like protein [Halopolyspora algeriensis]